jgi:hypothetical protein
MDLRSSVHEGVVDCPWCAEENASVAVGIITRHAQPDSWDESSGHLSADSVGDPVRHRIVVEERGRYPEIVGEGAAGTAASEKLLEGTAGRVTPPG